MSIDFYCECGQPMCGNLNIHNSRNVTITPCTKCLEEKEEEGREAGYEQGRSDFEET